MLTMARTPASTSPRRPFDPLLIVMTLGAVTAVAAMAYPAFRSDPFSAPGLILICAAAGVALIGLFAFGRNEAAQKPSGDAAVEILDALAEPAALVWASGQILAYNGAWAEAGGDIVSLPRNKVGGQALYAAFAEAKRGGEGRAIVSVGEKQVEVVIGRAGEGRFLMRAAPDALLAPVGEPTRPPPLRADTGEARAMAAGAPFGSGVIEGEDLFAGKLTAPNAALSELTGPAAARDAAFGHLFEPAGVAEARARLAAGSYGPIELSPGRIRSAFCTFTSRPRVKAAASGCSTPRRRNPWSCS
jgi:two-component system, cell cycle sensor histidine kinase and response regulator CckA